MRFVGMVLPDIGLDMLHVEVDVEWLDELPLNLVDMGMSLLQLK